MEAENQNNSKKISTDKAFFRIKDMLDRSQEIALLGSWELNAETNQLSWSDEVYRLFGFNPNEFEPSYEAFLNASHPEDREKVDKAYKESLLNKKDSYEIEHRIIRKTDGSVRMVREKCEHIKDNSGKIIRSVGIVQDITSRKRLETEIKKRAEENQLIIETAPAMIFFKDTKNRILRTNKFLEENLGYKKEQLEGKSMYDFFPKEQADKFFQDDLEVIASGKPKRNILEEIEAPKGKFILRTDKVPYFGEDGRVEKIIVMSIDITKDKENEKRLLESESKYRKLANSITDNYTAYDKNMYCTFRNNASQSNISMPNGKAIGKHFEELHPEMVGSKIHNAYLEVIKTRQTQYLETSWFHPEDAHTTYHEITIYPAPEGGISVISRNITGRKKMEKELARLASFPKKNPHPVMETDLDGNIIYQNPTAIALFPDLLEKNINHPWMSDWKEIKKSFLEGKIEKIDREVKVGGSYFKQTLHYLKKHDRIRIYAVDITEIKKKEHNLQKLNRTLTALSKSNRLLMRAENEQTYLENVCKIIIEDCGYKMVWIGYAKDNEEKSIKPVAYAGFEQGYLETLNLTYEDQERGRGPTGTAIRTGRLSICENMLTDPKFEPWKKEAIKRGYASSIAFPMSDNEKTFGAVTIYSELPNPFIKKEIDLLEELSNDITYGITTIRTKKAKQLVEDELQQSEARLYKESNTLNTIMNNSQAGLAYIDRDFNFVSANLIYCKINGRSKEDLIGKNYFDFFPSEENRLLFEKARETGNQIEIKQKPMVFKSQPWQKITYWDWTITPVKSLDHHVYGLVISLVDVSENVKAIEELKIYSQKLEDSSIELKKVQTAVENASDIIFITDARGRIIYINKAVKYILGYKQKEMMGKKPNFWMEDMPNKFFGQMWNAIYFNKKHFMGEIQDRKKNGEIFTAEIRIAPVLDNYGQILSFVGIERDVTEAKRLDTAKTEFISLAAHQLRTPITAVHLSAEMLMRGAAGKMDKEAEEYLESIMQGVEKMSEMIELFLNVSRIEMKTFEIVLKPCNIGQIIEKNIKAVLPQIKSKNLELRKTILDNLPEANTDPRVLDIVLENILSNAIKYTLKRGAISVSAEALKENIVIKVSDTGCGIPKDQQKKVFEKLFRAENASEKFEGLGLGLYLSKSIIEQAGGKIWLESEENKGSTFFISVPISINKRKT